MKIFLITNSCLFPGQYTTKNGLELNSTILEPLRASEEPCRGDGTDCVCRNLKPVSGPVFGLRWRFETWVTVVMTIAAVGILMTSCIAFFLMCKACTEVLVSDSLAGLGYRSSSKSRAQQLGVHPIRPLPDLKFTKTLQGSNNNPKDQSFAKLTLILFIVP